MRVRERFSCVSLIIGLVLMVLGAIDPLEGSVVIVLGTVLTALGATLGASRERRLLRWAFFLVAIGVGALWGLSAVGGVGGNSGRAMMWLAVVLPYPVGWLLGIVGAIRAIREMFRRPAAGTTS